MVHGCDENRAGQALASDRLGGGRDRAPEPSLTNLGDESDVPKGQEPIAKDVGQHDFRKEAMMRPSREGIYGVTTALALLLGTAPGAAQIPDEFTNLKLLPKDIEKRQLIGTMRDWAGGLGVRCNH